MPLEGKELEDYLASIALTKDDEGGEEELGDDSDEEAEDEESLVQKHDVPIPEEVM